MKPETKKENKTQEGGTCCHGIGSWRDDSGKKNGKLLLFGRKMKIDVLRVRLPALKRTSKRRTKYNRERPARTGQRQEWAVVNVTSRIRDL
jgi:hypothetical protein